MAICGHWATGIWVFFLDHHWHKTDYMRHYSDAIMGTMAFQITSLTIVYSSVYSGADQSKHQSSASLAFMRGIHRSPVNSPRKWPVTRKIFPFDDVIMDRLSVVCSILFIDSIHRFAHVKFMYLHLWYQYNITHLVVHIRGTTTIQQFWASTLNQLSELSYWKPIAPLM